MIGNLEVHIQGQKLDLFGFEDISVSDKIRDVRDVSKVFTSFSKQFIIPASPRNNKIFKHFYNIDISNGFDARIKVDASIKLSGVTYKEGKMTLTKASLKEGIPYSYSVVFYGKTVELPQILGDLELSDLTDTFLDNFIQEYSKDFVKNGLVDGYSYDYDSGTITQGGDDYLFPFISGESYYFYDSDPLGLSPKDVVDSRNLAPTANPAEGNKGLYYADLKPSVKVKWIIKAIEQKFGIEFSNEFFRDSNKAYNDLHMWLSREKGDFIKQLDSTAQGFGLNDSLFSFLSGTDWRGVKTASLVNGTDAPQPTIEELQYRTGLDNSTDNVIAHIISFRLRSQGLGSWTVNMRDKNQSDSPIIGTFTSTGDDLVELIVRPTSWQTVPKRTQINLQPFIEVITEGETTSYEIYDFNICRTKYIDFNQYAGCGQYQYDGTESSALSNGFNLISQFPKIKVIYFLTSIFKMFNLTAYYVPTMENSEYAGKIRVRTLDNFFISGKPYDLTNDIDTDKLDVSRNNLYSEINFEFEKPSTFALVNTNQFRPKYDEFGVERINNIYEAFIDNPLAFDGGKYNVKPKFEKMLYERMSDQNQESLITSIMWGWSANENEQPKLTKPILYYPINQQTDAYVDGNDDDIEIQMDLSTYDREGENTTPLYETITNYYRPSNSLSDYSSTLNFGDEFDEWGVHENQGGTNNSLFYVFYRRYILSIYNKQSRLINTKAYLDTKALMNMKLNDVIIINSRRYRINQIKDINLSSGLAELELMNDIAYSLNNLGSLVIARIENSDDETEFSVLDNNYSITQNIYDIYVDDVRILQNQSITESFTLDKQLYPNLDSSYIYIESILEGEQTMKSNVLTPLFLNITTESDNPIITEQDEDNLVVENDLGSGWIPVSGTYTSSAQSDYPKYRGSSNPTIIVKDTGDGSSWVTVSDVLDSGDFTVVKFDLDENLTGVSRTVALRANDGIDNPIFTITQNA